MAKISPAPLGGAYLSKDGEWMLAVGYVVSDVLRIADNAGSRIAKVYLANGTAERYGKLGGEWVVQS